MKPKMYIGTFHHIVRWKSNFGDIWVEQPNGTYISDQKSFVMTAEQIESDLRNGYVKEIFELPKPEKQ